MSIVGYIWLKWLSTVNDQLTDNDFIMDHWNEYIDYYYSHHICLTNDNDGGVNRNGKTKMETPPEKKPRENKTANQKRTITLIVWCIYYLFISNDNV